MTKQQIKRLAILAMTVAFIVFCYQGMMACDSVKRMRIQKDNVRGELFSQKAALINLEQNIERYIKETQEFQKYLFEEKDIPGFLDGLSSFANQTSVNILDMKVRKFEEVMPQVITESQAQLLQNKSKKLQEKKKARLSEELSEKNITLTAMPIHIKINGTYEDLTKFFAHIESFTQLLTISNIQLGLTKNYPQLKCDFTLRIYSFKSVEKMVMK